MAHVRSAFLLSCAAFLGAGIAAAQDPEAARVVKRDQVAHYQRVERELRAVTPPLDPTRAAARARVLDLLHEYWTRADFGVQDSFPGRREPVFVDGGGRRCAVAYLLDGTGCGDLTLRVAATANHAWIAELTADGDLQAWLVAHGLSIEEATRIQGPPTGGRPPVPQPPLPPWELTPRGGDATPAAAGTVPRPGTMDRDAATTGAAPIPAAAARAGSSRTPRGTAIADLASETWVPWFDLEMDRWLPARTARLPQSGQTGVDALHAEVAARLRGQLTDPEASVRAAATWALGQLGAAPALVKVQLADPAYEVRCSAIVALAAIGTASSTHALLELANDDDQLAMRPLILSALAASRHGDAAGDAIAERCVRQGADPALLGSAAAYARLRESKTVRQAALSRMTDGTSIAVRAQLASAFDDSADIDTVATLTKMASARGLDARRAAAAALARTQHVLALPALQTAFELEHDQAARSELLLAIGEHGGVAARAFLLEQMAAGPKVLRGWAALALGIWGRDRDDQGVIALVQKGFADERNQSAFGEWILALGLLRDAGSLPRFLALAHDGDSLTRGAAVYAMGLLDDGSVLPKLAAIMGSDHCPFVRGIAATVIGRSGDVRAVAMLAAGADGQGAVEVQQSIAQALGASGDRAAGPHLLRLAASSSSPVRAAALRGLGRLLASDSSPRFAKLGWCVDGRSLPATLAWIAGMDR